MTKPQTKYVNGGYIQYFSRSGIISANVWSVNKEIQAKLLTLEVVSEDQIQRFSKCKTLQEVLGICYA